MTRNAAQMRDEAAALPTLDHVFRWALRQEPRVDPVDVVIQDEYTHDVLFRVPDAPRAWMAADRQ